MSLSRIAVKQLSASDLSFFAQHLRASKQKAINLNSDVFVDRFYPNLEGRTEEVLFPLTIIGPGLRPSHTLTRKATRTLGAKNWRLDGEIVHDPVEEPGRFDRLQPNDFAILAFGGLERPEAVTLVLVSAAEDAALHGAVSRSFTFEGRETMTEVSEEALAELTEATRSAYEEVHPLEQLQSPDSVEEAVSGTASAQTRAATTDGKGARITQDAVRRQLRIAEETGLKGEELFNRWLISTNHEEADYEWVSLDHARATHDFHVSRPRWPGATNSMFVDVKATKGGLESPIHMSMAEVRWAASHANYRVARIYGVDSQTPKVAILAGIHEIAKGILDLVIPSLPLAAAIDSFEIDTTMLTRELNDSIL